jgi:[ribosomal protein S18]-alanine N-acetyltransferase
MSPEILFRDYRRADLEAMFLLDETCFAKEFRFDRRSMRLFAEEKGAVVRIAEKSDGEMVGFVIGHVERFAADWRGYVVTLDVAERYRKQGVARGLMLEAETSAATRARRMELHVFVGNEGAIRFYERMGYVRVGVRPGFYGEAGLDAFVYRKELVDV